MVAGDPNVVGEKFSFSLDLSSAWEWIGEEVSNPFVDCLRGDTIFEDFELTGDLWWDDLAIFLLLVLLVLDPWLPL
jgi:hypothetical protein